MSKHTPGPWRVGDAGHAIFGAPGSGLYPNAPICVVKGIANKANAKLIAAAPEMLDLLREVAEEFQPYSGNIGAPGSPARAKQDAEKALHAKIQELLGRIK